MCCERGAGHIYKMVFKNYRNMKVTCTKEKNLFFLQTELATAIWRVFENLKYIPFPFQTINYEWFVGI